jgi:hypothetical protein
MESRIFGQLSAWQNWIPSRPSAVGGKGALKAMAKVKPQFRRRRVWMTTIDYSERSHNSASICADRAARSGRSRQWQPNYLGWWNEMGPGSQRFGVYCTTVSAEPQG